MDRINHAFSIIDRKDFVPASQADRVHVDTPLPIGFEQTISQPSTVKQMLQWLDVQPGERIMDVGSGSGWTTALLSELTKPDGKVYAVEIIPELVAMGRNNCNKIGIKNAVFFQAKGGYGLPDYAPFDRILVSAAAEELPQALVDQLKVGGKLIIPVKNDILEITKTSEKDFKTITHPGFIFVPLKPVKPSN